MHCPHLRAQNCLGDMRLGKECLLLESLSLDGYVSYPILLGKTEPCGHAYLQGILETEREARQPCADLNFITMEKVQSGFVWIVSDVINI